MRTRQKCVATDTWRSLGCRTTPLEHWSRRKPTVEPRWAKQQTKKLRPKFVGSMHFQQIPFSDYLEITSAVVVPWGGRKTSRYSVVIFTFSGSLGLLGSEYRSTRSGWCDRCPFSSDPSKPRLLFFHVCRFTVFPKDPLFRLFKAMTQVNQLSWL